MKLRHLSSTSNVSRLTFNPTFDEVRTTSFVNVTKFWGEVSTFTKQRVATNTVIRFPNLFTMGNSWGNCSAIVCFWETLICIKSKCYKSKKKNNDPPKNIFLAVDFVKFEAITKFPFSVEDKWNLREARCNDNYIKGTSSLDLVR